MRAFAKRIRVPTNNARESLEVIIPARVTHPTATFTNVATSMMGRVITAFQGFKEMNSGEIARDSASKVTLKLPEGDFSLEHDVNK